MDVFPLFYDMKAQRNTHTLRDLALKIWQIQTGLHSSIKALAPGGKLTFWERRHWIIKSLDIPCRMTPRGECISSMRDFPQHPHTLSIKGKTVKKHKKRQPYAQSFTLLQLTAHTHAALRCNTHLSVYVPSGLTNVPLYFTAKQCLVMLLLKVTWCVTKFWY